MIDSRRIEDLHPILQVLYSQFQTDLTNQGIRYAVVSTYRDTEYQDKLFAQGRTTAGSIVTNLRGGYSYHNHRLAFDMVPLDQNGNPTWSPSDPGIWQRMGDTGKKYGLEWGGDWKSLVDKPHYQITFGLSVYQLATGTPVPEAVERGNRDYRVVRVIQTQLNKQGYQLQVDGSFGPLTAAAVTAFQGSRGLAVTGKADQATLRALYESQAVTPQHWVERQGIIEYLKGIGVSLSDSRYDDPMTRGEAFALAAKLGKVFVP